MFFSGHAFRSSALLVGMTALPIVAAAQPAITLPPPPVALPFLPSPSGDWTVTIGAAGELKPAFEGAKNYMFNPVPIVSIRRAGTPQRFQSLRDGASIALFGANGWRAGPVGKFKPARDAGSSSALAGLGDVAFAVELGAFVEYFPVDWLRTRVEVRHGFGGHHGVVADLSADVIVPVHQRVTVAAGPRLRLADKKAIAPYFGITDAQAFASGLPAFDAKGGVHSVGVGAQLRYRLNPQWELRSYVEYDRLLGSAADSPLVTQRGSPNQTTVGFGAAYSFDVRVR